MQGSTQAGDIETQQKYSVEYTNDSKGDWFGRITVQKLAGSLNSEHYAFNVTGKNYPRGVDRPQHSNDPPENVWFLAVQKLRSLEKGEDY